MEMGSAFDVHYCSDPKGHVIKTLSANRRLCVKCGLAVNSKGKRIKIQTIGVQADVPKRTKLTQNLVDLLFKFDAKCYFCGVPLDLETVTKEHLVALVNGGTSDESNIVAACAPCNNHKGAWSVDEFLSSEFLRKRIELVGIGRARAKRVREVLS